MAEGKNSFVLYTDNKELWESLTDEQAGKLIKHIFSYVNDESPELTDQLLKIAFIPIKQSLKRDLKKWEGYIEKQRLNGSKGGRPKAKETQKTQPFIEKPKKADSVTVSVTDSVSDTVTDTVRKRVGKKRFSAPSFEDVKDLFFEKLQSSLIAEKESKKFYSHYESNGWMVGKNKMKNWKSAVAGWITRMEDYGNTKKGQSGRGSNSENRGKSTFDLIKERHGVQ